MLKAINKLSKGMNFDKYTIKSQEALQKSAEIASSKQQQAIEPGHLLKAILETDENVSNYLFKKLNVNESILSTKLDEIVFSYERKYFADVKITVTFIPKKYRLTSHVLQKY